MVLLLGRVPSDYAIEEECRRVQYERRHGAILLRHEIGKLEYKRRAGEPVEIDLERRKRELRELLRSTHQADLGGWEALVLPRGGAKPDPAGWYVWGQFDASEESDDVSIRAPLTVWLRPTGRLAKLAVKLRLAP